MKEDEATTEEVIRLMKTRRSNTRARWRNVYHLWQEGKTLDQIGHWIGRSASTARQLLKRSFLEQQKQPGFSWPTDAHGRKICDVPHPMPFREVASLWSHRRERRLPGGKRGFCPVCKKVYSLPLTLVAIFGNETGDKI